MFSLFSPRAGPGKPSMPTMTVALKAAVHEALGKGIKEIHTLGGVYLLVTKRGEILSFRDTSIKQIVKYSGDVFADEHGNSYALGKIIPTISAEQTLADISAHPEKFFTVQKEVMHTHSVRSLYAMI